MVPKLIALMMLGSGTMNGELLEGLLAPNSNHLPEDALPSKEHITNPRDAFLAATAKG